MKIAIRAGHNEQAIGCAALINEVQESRNLLPHIIQTLKEFGNEVLDVTPGRMDKDSDLAYGVRKANEWGADVFISIHFNKAYNSYSGNIGAECWVFSKSDNIKLDEQVAQRVVDKLASAGFVGDNGKSRGVKESNELYELKQTKMAAVIVETCFVEATKDVELYKKLGNKKIGQLIAEGIANKTVNNNQGVKFDMKYIVQYENDVDRRAAEYLADSLKCPTIDSKRPFDYSKIENVVAVGGGSSFSGYTKYHVKGSDRYETAAKTIEVAKDHRKLENNKK